MNINSLIYQFPKNLTKRRKDSLFIKLVLLLLLIAPLNEILSQTFEDRTVSSREVITLDAPPGVSYLWNTGETTSSISFLAVVSGVHSVEVTDVSGSVTTHTINLRVEISNLLPSGISADATICAGDTVLLYAFANLGHLLEYNWSHGLGTERYHKVAPTETTTYTVSYRRRTGTRAYNITVTVLDAPVLNTTSSIDTICNEEFNEETAILNTVVTNPNTCTTCSPNTLADELIGYYPLRPSTGYEYQAYTANTNCSEITMSEWEITYGTTSFGISAMCGPSNSKNSCTYQNAFLPEDITNTNQWSHIYRFTVTVSPPNSGVKSQISRLELSAWSPPDGALFAGVSGSRRFILRVRKGIEVVYFEDNRLSRSGIEDFTFDFTNDLDFINKGEQTFTFELIAYCSNTNWPFQEYSLWELGSVYVYGGCCEGTTTNEVSYEWSTGDVGQTTLVTEPGVYEVTATNCECSTTDTIEVFGEECVWDAGITASNSVICSGDSSALNLSFDLGNRGLDIYYSTSLIDSATIVGTGHGGATLLASKVTGVVINEVEYVTQDRVELWNNTCETIDISNWWFYSGLAYDQINTLTVESGNLSMSPGEWVVLSGFTNISLDATGDLGLYNTNSFASTSAMEDFIQWGAGGLGRESVAVSKGIWTVGDFLPAISGTILESGNNAQSVVNFFDVVSTRRPVLPPLNPENGLGAADGAYANIMSTEWVIYDLGVNLAQGSSITLFMSQNGGDVINIESSLDGVVFTDSDNSFVDSDNDFITFEGHNYTNNTTEYRYVRLTHQSGITRLDNINFSYNVGSLQYDGYGEQSSDWAEILETFSLPNTNLTTAVSDTLSTGILTNATTSPITYYYYALPPDACLENATYSPYALDSVTVNPQPNITGQDTTICSGQAFNLSTLINGTLSGLAVYGTVFDNYPTPIATDLKASSTTTYFIQDSISATCIDTTMLTITVNPQPNITGRDTTICGGETIDLSSLITGSPINTLEYGAIYGTYGGSNSVSPISTTTYFVRDSSIATGCVDTTSVKVVIDVGLCAISLDWGDLPDPSTSTALNDYQTVASNAGPSHVIIAGLSLGTNIDAELNGQPSADALGDGADEDGLQISPNLYLVPGLNFQLPFSYTNTTGDTAHVEAWIDWNADGDFDDVGEMVVDINDGAGTTPLANVLPFSIPTIVATNTLLGLRIRISHQDNMTPYGLQPNGEIEDYLIGIDCPQVCLPLNVTIMKK